MGKLWGYPVNWRKDPNHEKRNVPGGINSQIEISTELRVSNEE